MSQLISFQQLLRNVTQFLANLHFLAWMDGKLKVAWRLHDKDDSASQAEAPHLFARY